MNYTGIALALLISGCAHTAPSELLARQEQCHAQGGEWTAPEVMYPELKLNSHTKTWYVCRLPTTDAGVACSGDGKECQGHCLAPPGSKLGEEIEQGICSAHQRVPNGTLVFWGGRVHNGYPILE